MTREKKLRIQWLSEWHIEEHESWFTDMARKGWKLEKLNLWIATFVESEPEEVRYRIEIAPKNDEIESDRIHLYNDAGWEYVTYHRYMYVFVEREANTAKEIHTDPELQADTIEILKKSIWRRGIGIVLLSLFVVVLAYISLVDMSSYYMLGNHIITLFIYGLLYIPMTFYWLNGIIHISSLVKRMKRGENFEHHKPYVAKLNWVRFGSYAVGIAYLILFGYAIAAEKVFSNEERFPAIPASELPVVTLADIENVSPDEVTYNSKNHEQGVSNYYREETSLLVPEQSYLVQKFIIPDVEPLDYSAHYEPSLLSMKYVGITENAAKVLTEALVEEEVEYTWSDQQTKVNNQEFDELWVYESTYQVTVIARVGKDVYLIYYNGNQSSEEVLRSLAEITL